MTECLAKNQGTVNSFLSLITPDSFKGFICSALSTFTVMQMKTCLRLAVQKDFNVLISMNKGACRINITETELYVNEGEKHSI